MGGLYGGCLVAVWVGVHVGGCTCGGGGCMVAVCTCVCGGWLYGGCAMRGCVVVVWPCGARPCGNVVVLWRCGGCVAMFEACPRDLNDPASCLATYWPQERLQFSLSISTRSWDSISGPAVQTPMLARSSHVAGLPVHVVAERGINFEWEATPSTNASTLVRSSWRRDSLAVNPRGNSGPSQKDGQGCPW